MYGPTEMPTVEFSRIPPAPPVRRRRLPWLLCGLLALLLLGGALYAVAPLRHPLPASTVELTLPASMAIPGTVPRLPWRVRARR